MARVEVRLDNAKVAEAIADAPRMKPLLEGVSSAIATSANAMSAGFRTGRFYDRTENKLKGNTQPRYASNVQRRGNVLIGLIYTANYAAQKDNHEHNTLLKSLKRG